MESENIKIAYRGVWKLKAISAFVWLINLIPAKESCKKGEININVKIEIV